MLLDLVSVVRIDDQADLLNTASQRLLDNDLDRRFTDSVAVHYRQHLLLNGRRGRIHSRPAPGRGDYRLPYTAHVSTLPRPIAHISMRSGSSCNSGSVHWRAVDTSCTGFMRSARASARWAAARSRKAGDGSLRGIAAHNIERVCSRVRTS